MTVHSQLLASGSTAAGPTTIYTVPAGKRTIVKSCLVQNAGTAGPITFTVHHGGADTAIFSLWATATGTNGASPWGFPWLVLDAGDSLKISYPTASGGWYSVSGAELDV